MPRTARRGQPPASTNAGRRVLPEDLTDAEVRALTDACGEGLPSCARNRALIAVLYRGGLRVSEALALCPKDLDPTTGAVRVLWGKGGPARTIGLDPGAFRLVGAWMHHRAALGLDARCPLFCTTRDGAVSSSYIRKLFNRLGERAGIQKRVQPMCCGPATRHTSGSCGSAPEC